MSTSRELENPGPNSRTVSGCRRRGDGGSMKVPAPSVTFGRRRWSSPGLRFREGFLVLRPFVLAPLYVSPYAAGRRVERRGFGRDVSAKVLARI